MKLIDRIKKIKNFRIFHNFMWPKNLENFKRYNLIYGWNGTGKSTISNIFRSIEKRTPITEAEVLFRISKKDIDGRNFEKSPDLPQVRVFNKEFIQDNIFTDTNEIEPILIIGEESIEKQKELTDLKKILRKLDDSLSKKQTRKEQLEKEFATFTTSNAKSIKDLLSSSGDKNQYNNYDKRKFQNTCDNLLKLIDGGRKPQILSEEDFNNLKKSILETPMEEVSTINFTLPDTEYWTSKVREILTRTAVSKIIEELKNDGELSEWIRIGLSKHRNKKSSKCLFCGEPLQPKRLEELEAHFSDEYESLIRDLKKLSDDIKSEIDRLDENRSKIPTKHQLYNSLASKYSNGCTELNLNIEMIFKHLNKLQKYLQEKLKSPLDKISKDISSLPENNSVIYELNEILKEHNAKTNNFHKSLIRDRKKVEESEVGKNLEEYSHKKNERIALDLTITDLDKQKKKMIQKINEIDKNISDHRIAADELNKGIHGYLNRNELTFEVKGNGYQIIRNGNLANNLSEGERTAIAFLYFLTSLKDKSFPLKDGIIVIDDPVSSLDANSLFSAFGYMKERTNDAGQLFILTHNHSFFRQVKNWFNYLNEQNRIKKIEEKAANFYMLKCDRIDNRRTSSIKKLDPLLYRFESEYHYLFSIIYKVAKSDNDGNLEELYSMPNVTRRFLESFLAFRLPARSGALAQKINSLEYSEGKKVKLLRFLHTYSHSDQIADPEHDPSILLETKSILIDLLTLIEKEDERHYKQMKSLIEKNAKK